MIKAFGVLLIVLLGIQVGRGVQAFRNPDQDLPKRRTSVLTWVLAIVIAIAGWLIMATAGAIIYGHDAGQDLKTAPKP